MDSDNDQPSQGKRKKYDEVVQGTKDVATYTDFLFWTGHKEFLTELVDSLANRKDADKLIRSAVLRSGWFWAIVIGSNIVIAFMSFTLSYNYPRRVTHVVQQVVNAKVPDLLPLPQEEE